MKDVIIIGAGLFGSIIAKALRQTGIEAFLIDNKEEYRGSKPAACLMKPSWYSALGPETYVPAMKTLEFLYNVETIEFKTKISKASVKWINPKSILEIDSMQDSIQFIERTNNSWILQGQNGIYQAKHIIIAAGIWCNGILQRSNLPLAPEISSLTGTAFVFEDCSTQPEISIWNPYKQLVKFQIEPKCAWVGDGIASKNYWKRDYLNQSFNRCVNFVAAPFSKVIAKTGNRPYVKQAKPCYLQSHGTNLWVVTGGAKNGTIAAGWAAQKMVELIG